MKLFASGTANGALYAQRKRQSDEKPFAAELAPSRQVEQGQAWKIGELKVRATKARVTTVRTIHKTVLLPKRPNSF
jgi:hypothetical protein